MLLNFQSLDHFYLVMVLDEFPGRLSVTQYLLCHMLPSTNPNGISKILTGILTRLCELHLRHFLNKYHIYTPPPKKNCLLWLCLLLNDFPMSKK